MLRWGGDAEGGAPFVEADPTDPQKLVGFDVEIAELDRARAGPARRSSSRSRSLRSISRRARGDFDIGLSGIEDTPARRVGAGGQRPVLPVPRGAHGPRGRSRPLSHARRPAGPPRRHARRHDRLRAAARGRARARHHRRVVRRRRASVHRPARSAASTRCCSTTCSPIARCAAIAGLFTQPGAGRDRPLHRHHRAAEHGAARSGRPRPARARCATARSKRSSASGTSGTTISRALYASVAEREHRRSRRSAGRAPAPAVVAGRGDPSLPAGAVSRGRDHARSCRAWRWRWPSRSAWRSRSAASTAIR